MLWWLSHCAYITAAVLTDFVIVHPPCTNTFNHVNHLWVKVSHLIRRFAQVKKGKKHNKWWYRPSCFIKHMWIANIPNGCLCFPWYCHHQVTSSWVREGRCWNCTVKWRQSVWTPWWEMRWDPSSRSTTAASPEGSTATSAWRTCWAAWGDLSSWTARWESGRLESKYLFWPAATTWTKS